MNARIWPVARVALIAVAATGLAIDAYVHLHLAADYNGYRSSVLTGSDLFRAEGVVAALAAVALIVRPRWYTALVAFAVAAGGTAAVLLYTYVDVGAIGPMPDMYEPIWFGEKTLSAWAEGIAAVAALALVMGFLWQRGHTSAAVEPARAREGERERVAK